MARLIISDATKAKLAGKHGLDWRDVTEALRAGKCLPPLTQSPKRGMMAAMRPEEAMKFYEEDEDPERLIAMFDAARDDGRLRQTRRPEPNDGDLKPLGQVRAELMHELRKQLRELHLGERVRRQMVRRIAHIAEVLRSRSRVH